MWGYAARLFGNTLLNFVSNFSLEGSVYDNTIFLKWGISNVPFCSMFVPFHFYLIIIMTLVVYVPCLDNIFMVLLISALAKIGATKPFFFNSGSPSYRKEGREEEGGGGGSCVRGRGLLS